MNKLNSLYIDEIFIGATFMDSHNFLDSVVIAICKVCKEEECECTKHKVLDEDDGYCD